MDMTALSFTFSPVSDCVAEMAIAALWQGALVAGVLTLCLRFLPRVSAGYRFMAWAAAFAVLVSLSLFSLLPAFSADAAQAISAHITDTATRTLFSRPLFSVDARWSLAIAALWLAASLFRAADLAIHSLRLRKLWKDAEPVELDERVEAVLDAVTTDCGPVEVFTTKALQRPSVIGFFKPRILIPDWLYSRLTQGELEQIILHEAEHLRRRDDWTNLAQKLCLVVFPLNPALVWIERRLCREREMACDEGVVRITRAPRAYAACLASLAERGLERRLERHIEALSLGAWQRRPEVVHRVHSILRSKGAISPFGARLLLSTLGCGLIAGSIELAQSPQLVAFVPVRGAEAAIATNTPNPPKTATETPAPVALLERTMTGTSGVRAVSTRASMGSKQEVAMDAMLRQPPELAAPPVKASHMIQQQKALPLMAKTQRPEQDSAQEQQWIVLTAWEQVETPSDNASAGLRSDYDAKAASNYEAARSPDQQPGSRITVTQLIFRVLPANADTNSAAKPAASPSTNQPHIATFRDGWLVIQL